MLLTFLIFENISDAYYPNMKQIYSLPLFFLLVCVTAYGQRGKNGSLTVSSSIKVNEYTALTADATAGNTSIKVANSALNTNGRFKKNLAPGDLIMIIQMQGATINGAPDKNNNQISTPNDSTWGAILNYNNCGNNEIREVLSVPDNTTINLTCPLVNNYTAAGKVQLVRIPRYTQLTINNGGEITCDAWDSISGGIIAIEVFGNTIINSGGQINAYAAGFRGGALINSNAIQSNISYVASNQSNEYGASKGEGIAGNGTDYNQYGGSVCMGAPANGGGGGDSWNGGGGGGANGGNISGWINGFGIPDTSQPGYISAWKQEYTWMPYFVGAGGGRGGYTWSGSGLNPLTSGPGNPGWAGDDRRSVGGRGGRPLDYSTGRLFLGGGGGAGSEDNNHAGNGGNGGGMIYLISYGTVSGKGMILSDGHNGVSDTLASGDGPGGAGAGGTIVINSVGNISGITIQANGGNGGDQKNTAPEGEGPGGGGGGGYIAASNGVTEMVNGGVNGTTTTFPTFPANGSTKGGPGDTAQVTNFIIINKNDTICANNTATLTASLSGTIPPGTVIGWYDSITGGNLLGAGATFTTPVLTQTTVFYVSTCPGTYRQPDTVFINSFNPGISSNDTVCKGDSAVLTASGGRTYLWNTSQTTSSIRVIPSATTTYNVAITGQCGKATESVTVYVSLPAKPVITGAISRCPGFTDTLIASGDNSYLWESGTRGSQYITGGIYADSTITVIGFTSQGCPDTASFKISMHPFPKVVISDTNSCYRSPVTIHAQASGEGPFTYLWMPGGATDSNIVVPDTGQTLTLTVSNGCDTTEQVTLVPVIPVFSACCDKVILLGDDTIITAHGFGSTQIKSYSWSPSVTCLNPLCDSVHVSPTITTTYTVIGTDSLGCETERVVTIVVEDVCFNFTVPNVFTPSDAGIVGLNSEFYIQTQNIDSWSIVIYDRWGMEMFKSTNPTQYWTGNTESGGQAPAGVYYYIIKGICQNTTYQKDGFVQLIR